MQAGDPSPGVQDFGMAATSQMTTHFGLMLLDKVQESHDRLAKSVDTFIAEQKELNKTLQ